MSEDFLSTKACKYKLWAWSFFKLRAPFGPKSLIDMKGSAVHFLR